MNRSTTVDILLLILGSFLILQFLGGIQFILFPLIFIFIAPFGVVGGALIALVYYRRKNRASKAQAVVRQGADLKILTLSTPVAAKTSMKRPKAATILVAVPLTFGVYLLNNGVNSLLVALAVFAATAEEFETSGIEVFGALATIPASQQFLQAFMSVLSVHFFALGSVSMMAAYAVYRRKKWSWKFALIVAVSYIAIDIAIEVYYAISTMPLRDNYPSVPIGIIWGGIMLYLLYRADVKSFLRKSLEPDIPRANT